MFNDESIEVVEFVSTVTSETETTSNATQTINVDKQCQEVQKLEHNISEIQTDDIAPSIPNVDYNKLAKFLKRVTPDILEALDETVYETGTSVNESTIAKPQAQLLSKFLTLNETNSQMKTSALTWSTNGGTLGIAYSALTHKTWCDHLSQVKLYEFKRHNEIQENLSVTYDTNACVSCLSYHPIEPSILSAGLFNGDVILWKLTSDNSTTPINVYTHGDTVTSLIWRTKTLNDPTLLVTSSSDGYIVFNKLLANFTDFKLHRRYKIIKEHNPVENSRPRSAGGRRERAIETGLSITCLDFSSKNPIIFIIGTLCGGLYKCSTESITPIQGDDSLIDPVIDQYVRCDGSVISVKCSPVYNIFVSSDTNKEIRIFDIAESSYLRVIYVEYTITGLQWVTNNQDVILAHGVDPVVKCFNILNGTVCPKSQIQCSMTNTSCLDVNKKRDIVGIADSRNNLEIWKIQKIFE